MVLGAKSRLPGESGGAAGAGRDRRNGSAELRTSRVLVGRVGWSVDVFDAGRTGGRYGQPSGVGEGLDGGRLRAARELFYVLLLRPPGRLVICLVGVSDAPTERGSVGGGRFVASRHAEFGSVNAAR